MTLNAHYSKQFKKDLKRAKKRGKDVKKLQAVIDLLCDGKSLPARYDDHPLSGEWKGCRDCHLEFDWVLIYELYPSAVHFHATGTHADLFDK